MRSADYQAPTGRELDSVVQHQFGTAIFKVTLLGLKVNVPSIDDELLPVCLKLALSVRLLDLVSNVATSEPLLLVVPSLLWVLMKKG